MNALFSARIMPDLPDWTVADVDHLPDDELRYELLDGILLVTPNRYRAISGCCRS